MISPEYLPFFLSACGVVNTAVFSVYAADKFQARRGAWRTSVVILLTLALFGPFGAYAAMLLFHHKTRKPRFWLVPFFLCTQLVLAGYLILGI